MRAVVQRVTRGEVTVDGQVVGAISGPGLAVLVGVTHDDGAATAAAIARKVANLRILREEQSALDVGAPVLVVSQFTLYADTAAEPLVEAVANGLRDLGLEVATGSFGAEMAIDLVLDGPMTILIEA